MNVSENNTANSGKTVADAKKVLYSSDSSITSLKKVDYSAISNGFGGYRNSSYENIMGFKDIAFTVGETDAFSNIINNFFESSDVQLKKVDDYLNLANERIEEIYNCMSIDTNAWVEADLAANAIKREDFAILEEKTVNGVTTYEATGNYDDEAWHAAQEAKRQEVWVEKRCYLWNS